MGPIRRVPHRSLVSTLPFLLVSAAAYLIILRNPTPPSTNHRADAAQCEWDLRPKSATCVAAGREGVRRMGALVKRGGDGACELIRVGGRGHDGESDCQLTCR